MCSLFCELVGVSCGVSCGVSWCVRVSSCVAFASVGV